MIHEGLGHRNFNAFLNRYRIDDAKAALSDPSQRDVQVLTIAMDAGFQFIGPFNRAFKADIGYAERISAPRPRAIASRCIAKRRQLQNRPVPLKNRLVEFWIGQDRISAVGQKSLGFSLEPRPPMPTVTDVDPTAERLHALDAVRGFALLLGIILHATLSFIPAPRRFWIIQDTHPSMTLALLFFAIHVFRMTTFFLMAGFFAHMSFHRRGAWGFVKDRMQRIALPLVVAWPIVFAALAVVVIWAAGFPNGGPTPGAPNWPVLPGFPLTHLWFLYVLLEFYAAMLLLRGVVVWLDRSGRFRTCADRLIAQIMRSPLAAAILAVPIGIAFSLDPTWVGWFGVRTPDDSLLTNLQALIGFGTAFSFGWLLHRQIDLLRILEKRWLIHLAFAIGLIVMSFLVALSPALSGLRSMPISIDTLRLAGAAFYALAIWTTTFAAIGLALRFMSGFSPTRRYLADASYLLYLIHIPIVVALQVAVSPFDWPGPIKFAAILAVALPVMLASYHLLVRYTYIGIVLNGRRFRRDRTGAVATGFATP